MGLIYFKGLAWKFSAETVTILAIELLVAVVAMQRTMRLTHASFLLALFPLSQPWLRVCRSWGGVGYVPRFAAGSSDMRI